MSQLSRTRPHRAETDQARSSAVDNPRFANLAVHLLLEPRLPARQHFDSEKFIELCDSIRAFGRVLVPLVVEEEGEQFRIHAGHRRWEAAKNVGIPTVPCMVWASGTVPGEAVKSHENAAREDLNAAAEAVYFRALLEGECGNDVDKLAELVKQKPLYVQRRLALVLGDSRVFEGLSAGVITIGVAEELNKVRSEGYRLQYLTVAAQGGCSVRQMTDWRIQANMQYQESPEVAAAPMPEAPPPPQPASHNPSCLFCGSREDQFEMQVLFAHRSCLRAAERQRPGVEAAV